MKKYVLIFAMIAASFVAIARPAAVSIRQVRDPVQFRSWINTDLVSWLDYVNDLDAGAKNGATVTASDTGDLINKTVLTLAGTPVSVVYGGGTTNAIGSTKIYDLPAGRILILGVTASGLQVASFPTNTMDAADGGDIALGTAVPGADGAIDGTAVDLLPALSIDPITNVVSGALAASAHFDGTTTAKDVFLNVLVDHGDLTGASTNALTVNGVVTVHWINLGDY